MNIVLNITILTSKLVAIIKYIQSNYIIVVEQILFIFSKKSIFQEIPKYFSIAIQSHISMLLHQY